jgi:hypothetical protein
VIAVDQHSRNNHPAVQTQTEIVWTAEDSDRKHYVAVFNISDQPQETSYTWKQLGLMKARYRVRDLWQKKNLGAAAWMKVKLAPHASALYEVESF